MATRSGPDRSFYAPWEPDHRRRPLAATLREAIEEDLDAAAELAERHSGLTGRWRENFGRDFAEADRALFVAKVATQIVGYGRIWYFTPAAQSPADVAPEGWYLGGLLVDPRLRGAGIGEALTRARMDWLARRTGQIWYFANAANLATLALHARLGFEEVTRSFTFPGLAFDGGIGVLCCAKVAKAAADNEAPELSR